MILVNRFRGGLGFWISFCVVGLLLTFVVPHFLDSFGLNLLGKFLTYAIIAVGLDLIWGYGGMLSLGQGLFFGIGGYAFAMYLKLEASGTHIPDFMDYNGMTTLPAFWKPFHSPVFALLAALLVPAALAGLIGFLIFRSRIQGVYFSIITQALTLMASILFIGQQGVTGGTNGITDLSTIFGHSLSDDSTQKGLYIATVICLGLVYLLARWITRSRFGRLLIALRDDENRVRFLGYNPVIIKTLTFALSGAMAGLAGALFVPQVGIISPSAMDVVPSIEMVIWVAVGGRATLVGAVLGAVLVNWGKSTFNDTYPDKWQYFLGALFIGTVLLFPEGVVGYVQRGVRWVERKRGAMTKTESVAIVAAEREAGVEVAL
jgi:urea transport system permease protein